MMRKAPPKPSWYLSYWHGLFLALDQLVNAIFGGHPDETLSSRLWRKRAKSIGWRAGWYFIDGLWLILFWQKDHCQTAYLYEMERAHFPPAAERDF